MDELSMQTSKGMLVRIRNWADKNKSLFIILSGTGGLVVILTAIISASSGVIPAVTTLMSLLSLLLTYLIQYAEIIQWLLLSLVAMSVLLCYRTLSKRISELGNIFAHRSRYIVTQGGSIDEPSWKFDLVLLGTKTNNAMDGMLRTVGGMAWKNESKEDRKTHDWHDCFVTLHDKTAITLRRPLIGNLAGNEQLFQAESSPTAMTINSKAALVWKGQWTGYGADKAKGAFIIYLD